MIENQSPGATYVPPARVPTVGRAVHFWSESSHGYKTIFSYEQPHAATVAYVHPGDPARPCVNLQCIDHNGNPYTALYVELREPAPNDRHGIVNYATWPSIPSTPGSTWPGVAAVVAAARERAGEVG